MAKIDVLLPVKNGVAYLAEAIDSIINQNFSDWRLIVLDHGSTDGSYEMALDYAKADQRIVVFQFLDAVGLSGLLNKGLELCQCDFVMRHDADDVAFPDRMEKSLAAFARHPHIDVIGGHALKIDAEGKETGLIKVPTDIARLQAAFFFKNPIIHPTVMMRFSTIQALAMRYGIDFINLLPESEQLVVNGLAEDYYLFGQLGVLGKCLNIDEVLIKYRWHGNNVGAKKFLDQISLSIKISRYLAASFSARHSIERFDPAPFCTYGGTVLEIVPNVSHHDLASRFNKMSDNLSRVLGKSNGLSRELAYRKVLSTRHTLCMLIKYMFFTLKNSRELDEWYAVKNWVTRKIKRRQFVSVELLDQ
ncbi:MULTISPECIES: glycosyltransferase [unclassified Methylophilus]|uniref:glycosyltransferase family 2 protein n=1 Tax=unclassified Methylophilus TaxID=2630143 RepID=UPI0003646B83|nr:MULTISPECIES: glycosyltransferase [unclassified Methylophilus]